MPGFTIISNTLWEIGQSGTFRQMPKADVVQLFAKGGYPGFDGDLLQAALNLPEVCRIYRIEDRDTNIITDISTDPVQLDYAPILDFMFYRPLSRGVKYYLAIYQWSVSEQVVLLDGRRKIAVQVVFRKEQGGDVRQRYDLVQNRIAEALAMNEPDMAGQRLTDRFQIDWLRAGFGGSKIFQTTDGKHARLISDPLQPKPMEAWLCREIANHLCVSYYSGMAPLNPELIVVSKRPDTGENFIPFLNTRLFGAFDFSGRVYDEMNPYRQSLFDTFASIGAHPSGSEREIMRQTFLDRVAVIRQTKDTTMGKFRQAISQGVLGIAANADEVFAKKIDEDSGRVFDALFPPTLMYRPTVVNRDPHVMLDKRGERTRTGFFESLFTRFRKEESKSRWIVNGPAETIIKYPHYIPIDPVSNRHATFSLF